MSYIKCPTNSSVALLPKTRLSTPLKILKAKAMSSSNRSHNGRLSKSESTKGIKSAIRMIIPRRLKAVLREMILNIIPNPIRTINNTRKLSGINANNNPIIVRSPLSLSLVYLFAVSHPAYSICSI